MAGQRVTTTLEFAAVFRAWGKKKNKPRGRSGGWTVSSQRQDAFGWVCASSECRKPNVWGPTRFGLSHCDHAVCRDCGRWRESGVWLAPRPGPKTSSGVTGIGNFETRDMALFKVKE